MILIRTDIFIVLIVVFVLSSARYILRKKGWGLTRKRMLTNSLQNQRLLAAVTKSVHLYMLFYIML